MLLKKDIVLENEDVRDTWVPSKLNLAVANPIELGNNPWYKSGNPPNWEEFVNFLRNSKFKIPP